jgi:hypothetical protein
MGGAVKDITITKIVKPAPREFKAGDVTGIRMDQFLECKDIGPEPAINAAGFWKKPVHGITIKKRRSKKNGQT